MTHREREREMGQNDKARTKYRPGEKERLSGNIFQSEADYSLFRHVSDRFLMPLMRLASYSKG